MTITRPPESTTVCRGSKVTISCGYECADALPVMWIINGMSFTEDDILNNPSMYRLNNLATPNALSLSVSSVNDNTTFQCIVHSNPDTTTSRQVTVATGMLVHT